MLAELLTHAAAGTGLFVTAKPYLDDVVKCLGTDGCPAKAFDLTGEQWAAMQKEASDRLVYCDPNAIVTKSMDESQWKGLNDASEIPPKAIMVYDAVLATKDKDRDGDIVHPDGITMETKMPLLWQHVWSSPIGVMVKTLEQNSDRVVNRYAIADTPLGRDAATLVGFGAMRKSHGFIPVPGEFSPIGMMKTPKGEVPTGFDIRKLHTHESSLVSVPAGAKAVVLASYEKEFTGICDAVSQKKLVSPIVQKWAERLYESRTKVFGGATLPASEATPRESATADSSGATGHDETSPQDVPPAVVEKAMTKDTSESVIEKESRFGSIDKMLRYAISDEMPGSFESIQDGLRTRLEKRHRDDDGYPYLVATFTDGYVYCLRSYQNGEAKKMCYRGAYAVTDGVVSLSDDPTEVMINMSIVDKSLSRQVIVDEPSIPSGEKSMGDAETIDSTVTATTTDAEPDPILSLFS